MHGSEVNNRKRKQHMRSVPTRGTRTAAGDLVASSSCDSFYKDGRRISVGDCALFKPPQDCPPFIGIIRSQTLSKKSNLQLSVNWLYRPTEVKLGKGIPPDALPNEIFYSFHKDEIPAASLLHPCKVAFLPKGVDLPPGISSFVCWRVYDVASRSVWWLTDQDDINDQQEELDRLLYKTRIEMHATSQSGGRSPKLVNSPTSTSQLKPCSDNINGSTSFPSLAKGKKRERGDQGLEHVKRERSLKTDNGASSQLKAESVLNTEIANITEKGGVVEYEGVEKLVQLMQPDSFEKKLDLTSRSMLAGVIAATDKFDCLNRFVQLRGLPVLDDWIQDVHKGKIGDSGSPKDGDKNVEEFLWLLLCALDKLPVNLHALQMCNIGRSVNHLRTHKNLEIQKKARGLVDTWKKRVEAEMNVIDAKSGSNQAVSWPSKSHLPEVSNSGSRHPGGSSEVAVKSSVTEPSASKSMVTKPFEGEDTVKSASSSPGPSKSVLSPTAVKDNQPRISVGNASDLPSTVREEKSSSSQCHNYSHSFSGKEGAMSSSAGSMSVNKMSGGASWQRKSITGLGGTGASGGHRETRSSRNSLLNRNSASEKVLHSVLTCERAVDVPVVEGNGHKLIVKVPNRGRSPAQSPSGGSFEDPSIMNSRASSPVISEKQDQFDHSLKEKSDGCRANVTSDVNTESWQSNDFKDVLTGSDEGDRSPAAIADEERSRIADDSKKPEVVKTTSSSSGNELKSGKLHETHFSSMNALIESCVKYSEANVSLSPGDDIGMNLLASVAAGEMSKSDLVSPIDSPQRNIPIGEDTCMGDDARSKALAVDNFPRDESQANDGANVNSEKQGVTACCSFLKDGLHLSKLESANISGDRKTAPVSSEETPTIEHIRHSSSSIMDLYPTANTCVDTCEKPDELKNPVPMAGLHSNRTEKAGNGELNKFNEVMEIVKDRNVDGVSDTKPKRGSSLSMAEKVNDSLSTVEDDKQSGDVTSNSLPQIYGKNKDDPSERFIGIHAEQIRHSGKVKPELVETTTGESLHCTGSSQDFVSESSCDFKVGKADEKNIVKPVDPSPGHSLGGDGENKGVFEEHSCGEDVPHKEMKESSAFSSQEADKYVGSKESKLSSIDADEKKKFASVMVEPSSSFTAGVPDSDTKLKFDLNEGFITDDGKFGELVSLSAPGCSSAVKLINPLPFSVSSVSCNLPSSITVAAAAKGPFVPPDDLLKCKGELGWKGSAATSAFRPAESRKVDEVPQASTSTPVSDATSSRQGHLPLDIDLNVPDERVLKDVSGREGDQGIVYTSDLVHNNLARNELGSATARNPGGLDLDLNQVDEANDMGQYSASTSYRLDIPLLQVKSTSSGRISNGEVRRNFDLNDGPSFDDTIAEPSLFSQQNSNSVESLPHPTGIRMSNPEIVNFSSWFSPANAYSAVAIPSILSDRGEQTFPMVASGAPQRMLGVTPDVYRGSLLSSSPALPFPSTPFQYPVFPFGTSFPLPSATFGSTAYMESSSGGRLCFSAGQSQLLGPAGAVSTQYPRPCVINGSEGGNNGGMESNRKWSRQGLDLNAGPGVQDLEVRDDAVPIASRQLSVASSQAIGEEEQTRICQMASGVLKRKEPEGGWERAFGTSNPRGNRNL